ncbi:MAG: hypothetical protein AB8B60_12955 [Sulfitobacter sp.]
MAIEGLTPEQSDFVERFLKVPKVFNRKDKKRARKAAVEEFRVFNAGHDMLRDDIVLLEDTAVRDDLLARLAGAEEIIEADPAKLDFAGGAARLAEVEADFVAHVRQIEAQAEFAKLSKLMAGLEDPLIEEKGRADAQSDIALTWGFVQERMQTAEDTGDIAAYQSALRAMGRLEGMVQNVEKAKQNPFEARAAEADGAVEAGKEALEAPRRLADTFEHMAALNAMLAAQFGEGAAPLGLRLACSAVQNKLAEAKDAEDSDLDDLAEEAEDGFLDAKKQGEELLRAAQIWTREHAAFKVRLTVMEAHPQRANDKHVKPEFEQIRATHSEIKATAEAHEYAQACTALTKLRHDLSDALDVADDCANYFAKRAECETLLATLPAPENYPLTELAQNHRDAHQLMEDADEEFEAKKLTSALSLLNRVPGAVADIKVLRKFATQFKALEARWQAHHSGLTDREADVLPLIKEDIIRSADLGQEAQDTAEAGDYKRAAGRMLIARKFAEGIGTKADLIVDYLNAHDEFAERLKAVTDLKETDGRPAIEPYCQAMLGDEAKRAAAHDVRDFRLAMAMCERLEGEHEAQMNIAASAAVYYENKALFDLALAELVGETSQATLEAKATAERMRDDAVAATLKGNWNAAGVLMQSATIEVRRAANDAETAALIDGAQGPDSAMNLTEDSDFDMVYLEFELVKLQVEKLDTDHLFADALADADKTAKSAEALMPGDLTKASAALNSALEACRAVALQITAIGSFTAQRELVSGAVNAVAQNDTYNLVTEERDTANAALARADEVAGDPRIDFAEGVDALAEAHASALSGLEMLHLFTHVALPATAAIDETMKAYSASYDAEHFGKELTELEETKAGIERAFADRASADVRSLADKGHKLASMHTDIIASCTAAQDRLAHIALRDISDIRTHPITRDAGEELSDLIQSARDAVVMGNFRHAEALALQARRSAVAERAKAESYDVFLPLKIAAETRMEDIEPRAVVQAGPAHEAVISLRQRLDAALEKEAQGNFGGAAKGLEGFDVACDQADGMLALYDRYVLTQSKAQAALAQVRQLNVPAIETLMVRLDGKNANAERAGQAFDFQTATTLFEELIAECATAEGTAERVDGFVKEAQLIKSIGEDDVDDLKSAIAKAEDKLNALCAHPSAIYLRGQEAKARKLLHSAQAKAEEDFAAARVEVGSVVDICVLMAVDLAKYDRLNEAAEVARRLADGLLTQTPQVAFLTDEIHAQLDALHIAMKNARTAPANRAQSEKDVETSIAVLRDMGRVLETHKGYLLHRGKIEENLAAIEKSEDRATAREDLLAARKHLDAASALVIEHKHPQAVAELNAAQAKVDFAQLRIQLAGNKTPSKEDVTAALEGPGGLDAFDEMVEALPLTVQRQVLAIAFEVRFGCVLELKRPGDAGQDQNPEDVPAVPEDALDAPAFNIRAFYQEMAKLPASNTLDNDSMLTFEYTRGEQEGSSFEQETKRVRMREGDEEVSHIYNIAVEHEIGELDKQATPKPGEDLTAFGWNTLHEVGHAVDDKLGYMKKHGERLAGWKTYGANVTEAARAIAGKYDFDESYVAEYMMSPAGRDLPIPPANNCGPEEWGRRMQDCRVFVDRARVGNQPWKSASIADACAVGEYTYLESYPGDWARYRTSARKLAVSGYQFRAPGEWFSELYAAMCTDRLNDHHPHRDEMGALCMRVDV